MLPINIDFDQTGILGECERLRDVMNPLNEKIHGPLFGNQKNTILPFVFLLGNHSSGKSTFINHILKRNIQKTGVAPTDDSFTVIMPGSTDVDRDGPALVSDPDLGMIDSPGSVVHSVDRSMDRGYYFEGVVKWFADRADVILLFFDPDKPGTTGETLSTLTHSLLGMEHKLHIILNKSDQFVKIHDFARAYGSLCWNLSKVIPRKDLPRIYTMCLPTYGNSDADPRALTNTHLQITAARTVTSETASASGGDGNGSSGYGNGAGGAGISLDLHTSGTASTTPASTSPSGGMNSTLTSASTIRSSTATMKRASTRAASTSTAKPNTYTKSRLSTGHSATSGTGSGGSGLGSKDKVQVAVAVAATPVSDSSGSGAGVVEGVNLSSVGGGSSFHCLGIADLEATREEVIREVFNAPKRRIDNELNRLAVSTQTLHMHTTIISHIHEQYTVARNSALTYFLGTSGGLLTALVGTVTTLALPIANATAHDDRTPVLYTRGVAGLVHTLLGGASRTIHILSRLPPRQQLLLLGSTVVSGVGIYSYYYYQKYLLKLLSERLTSLPTLESVYLQLYSKQLTRKDEFVTSIWNLLKQHYQNGRFTAIDLQTLSSPIKTTDFHLLEKIIKTELQTLRRIAAPFLNSNPTMNYLEEHLMVFPVPEEHNAEDVSISHGGDSVVAIERQGGDHEGNDNIVVFIENSDSITPPTTPNYNNNNNSNNTEL